jgi:hypothetical protein
MGASILADVRHDWRHMMKGDVSRTYVDGDVEHKMIHDDVGDLE